MTPLYSQKLANNGVLESSYKFKSASEEDLNRICNGCGASDAWFDFVPDRIWGTDVSAACHIHDWDYEYGLNKEAKKLADKRMHKNIKTLVDIDHEKKKYKPEFLMKTRARVYYWGVKYFGKRAFWRNKNTV